MPEIKNTFIQGKMNKDLDERLIPNGQYRDALNIGVTSSETSDAGAIENILGNTQVELSYQRVILVSVVFQMKRQTLYIGLLKVTIETLYLDLTKKNHLSLSLTYMSQAVRGF